VPKTKKSTTPIAEETAVLEHPKLKWGPVSAVTISFLAYILSQLILFIPLAIIATNNHGQDIQTLLDNSPWVQLALTGIASSTLLAVLWLFLKRRKSSFKDLGFRAFKASDISWVILGAVIYYGALIMALSLANLIPGFDLGETQTIGYLSANGWQKILAFIGLVAIPPLAEEMLFRGFLYRGLARRWPKYIAAIISSLLFAVVHFQWNVGVDVFVLSMVMILLYEKTKNLWVCVALHGLKNLVAYLMLFVFTGR
jgi:membrane protease YdiL (CAAX protease family)